MPRRKWTNETVDSALINRNIKRITDTTQIKQPSTTKLEWLCLKCSHGWHATLDNIVNKHSGCPKCAGNFKMTIGDCQHVLDQQHRQIDVLDLFDGHRNNERKGLFRCKSCNNNWTMVLSNLLGKKQGCPSCGKCGRYTQKYFDRFPDRKNDPAILYVLKLTDTEEEFLKLGITKRNVKTRFTTSVPYIKTTLCEVEMTLYEAYNIEQQLLLKYKEHKYVPHKHFGGKTECLSQNVELKILQELNDDKNNPIKI